MDAAALNRVKFLAGDDAYAYWQAKGGTSSRLDTALAEYGDLRLVAAYVLETACQAARLKAAEAASLAGPQVKRLKIDGELEREFFAPGTPALVEQADAWCRQAAALRAEVARPPRPTRPRSVVYRPEVDG